MNKLKIINLPVEFQGFESIHYPDGSIGIRPKTAPVEPKPTAQE